MARTTSNESQYLDKADPRFVNEEIVTVDKGVNRNGGAYLAARLTLRDATPAAVLTAAGKLRRPDYRTASVFYAGDKAQLERIAAALAAAAAAYTVSVPAAALAPSDMAAEIARLTAENAAMRGNVVSTAPAADPMATMREEIARLAAENAALAAASQPAAPASPLPAVNTTGLSGAASKNATQSKLRRIARS